jgi:hypothetical protein
MDENNCSVYIKTDANNNIVDVNSSIYISDLTDWVYIDSGAGDKYRNAQNNYFEKGILCFSNVYRYTYIDGVIAEKTDAVIAAEIAAITVEKTASEKLVTVTAELTNAKAQIEVLDAALMELFLTILPSLTV